MSFLDNIQAPDGAKKLFSGQVPEQTHLHQVHHSTATAAPDLVMQNIAVVEDVIRRGKDDAGLYGSPEFLAAVRHIKCNDLPAWMRLRSEIKREKPSGVRLLDIDRLSDEEDDYFVEVRPNTSDTLVRIVKNSCELCFDEDLREAFVTIPEVGTLRVQSQRCAEWLGHQYYKETQTSASDNALKQASATISGLCRYEGVQAKVFLRVGRHSDTGAYYLDNVGENGASAIEITATGWQVVDDCPLKFWRPASAIAFPKPIRGGNLDQLWELVNIPESARLLVLAWILEAFRPETPYVILELIGIQGTAKSTTQKRFVLLIDPSSMPLRSSPKSVEDLFVSAKNNHLVSLDNLSFLTPALQDALCIMSTSGSYARRKLYTDGDESVFQVKRPTVLSGINNAITAQDLIDRTIHIELPQIESRRLETELDKEWDEAWPEIFGALLDLFVKTLAQLKKGVDVSVSRLRMADFHQLGEAMAQAMGHQPGTFTELYAANNRQSILRAVESSPVTAALIEMAQNSPTHNVFEGSYKALLNALEHHRFSFEDWPRGPKGLANALKRQAPALQVLGISVRHSGRNKHGSIVIIERTGAENTPVAMSGGF